MVDRGDTLFGHPTGRLCLTRADPAGLAQIAFWPATAAAVHRHINALAGLATTLKPGRFVRADDRIIIRSAFHTYLLVGMAADSIDLPPDQAAVTELSDARCGVSITGPAAESFLNRDIAVDLSLSACPIGSAIQTPMHHVPVLLLRTDETGFVLFAYRSYAEDLIAWMRDMAVPLGG